MQALEHRNIAFYEEKNRHAHGITEEIQGIRKNPHYQAKLTVTLISEQKDVFYDAYKRKRGKVRLLY